MESVRALVTGGCGFIGSNLTKRLVQMGWQVDVVDDMSNGHLQLLDGLNTRVLLNGSLYTAYRKQGVERLQDEGKIARNVTRMQVAVLLSKNKTFEKVSGPCYTNATIWRNKNVMD